MLSGSAAPEGQPAASRNAASRQPSQPKKRGTGRIGRGLISLSAAAIITVYGAGYFETQFAAAQVPAQASQLAASSPIATTSTGPNGAISVSSPNPATTTASGYQNGTYTGTGTSRHGNITASVVIQGGKIISAAITQSSTRYPTSAISALPGEVLAAQGTQVNFVSGATDSSSAYLTAVQNALAQAG